MTLLQDGREGRNGGRRSWAGTGRVRGGSGQPLGPWPLRHFTFLDEAPVDVRVGVQSEEVAHSGTDIDPGVLVGVCARSLSFENVLPVINGEGADVFPLGVGDASLVMDGDPAVVTDRDAGAPVAVPEPGNDLGGFRSVLPAFDQIVLASRSARTITELFIEPVSMRRRV